MSSRVDQAWSRSEALTSFLLIFEINVMADITFESHQHLLFGLLFSRQNFYLQLHDLSVSTIDSSYEDANALINTLTII
jgi:hypothetical protein